MLIKKKLEEAFSNCEINTEYEARMEKKTSSIQSPITY